MTDDVDLVKLRELVEKATPGPWETDPDRRLNRNVYSDDATGSVVARCGGKGFEYVQRACGEEEANAALIALTPTLARLYLSQAEEIERLKRRITELTARSAPYDI